MEYAFNISINTLEVAILKVLVIWITLAITLKKFYNHLKVSRTKHFVFVQRFKGGSTNSKIPHLMMMDRNSYKLNLRYRTIAYIS